MLKKEEVSNIFAAAKAIITNDHFVYAKKSDGWYHGSAYVNKDAIYPYTKFISLLCRDIAYHFLKNADKADVIVGPTVGAVSLSQWTAHHYGPDVLSVYADEADEIEKIEIKKEMISENKIKLKNLLGEAEIIFAPGSRIIDRIVYRVKVGTRRILKRGYDKIVKGKKCLVVEDIVNSGATP